MNASSLNIHDGHQPETLEDEKKEDCSKQLQSTSKNQGSKQKFIRLLKIPKLELRIFDHSFPYGLSLPSDVIKQVSLLSCVWDRNYFSSKLHVV